VTQEERKRMFELCNLIQDEKDQERFRRLVEELNDLFEQKGSRLGHSSGQE
jgi:hypothetical protein